ncbi:MAG: lysostaphin resistance A-like protein [Sarcina sp.]
MDLNKRSAVILPAIIIGIPLLIIFNLIIGTKIVIKVYCDIYNLNYNNMEVITKIYDKKEFIGSVIGDVLTLIILIIIFMIVNKEIVLQIKSKFKRFKIKDIKVSMVAIFFLVCISKAVMTLGNSSSNENIYISKSLIEILAVIFIIPILEEIIFRYFIYIILKQHLNKNIAIIIQAILFGFVHMAMNYGDFLQGVYTFILGIILGIIYSRKENLNEAIVIHVWFNILGLFL